MKAWIRIHPDPRGDEVCVCVCVVNDQMSGIQVIKKRKKKNIVHQTRKEAKPDSSCFALLMLFSAFIRDYRISELADQGGYGLRRAGMDNLGSELGRMEA